MDLNLSANTTPLPVISPIEPSPKPTFFSKKLICLLAGLIIIIVGLLGYFYFTPDTKLQSSETTKIPTPTLESSNKYGSSFSIKVNNTVRDRNINLLLEVILLYKKDHGVVHPEITTEIQPISKQGADLCQDLTKTKQYIGALPRDPAQQFDPSNNYAKGGSITNCDEDYVTGFTVFKDANEKVTVQAPLTVEIPMLSVTEN